MKKYILILLIFTISGWFLLTFRILDVPPGINGDEAPVGLNAAAISRTGHDSEGRFLPLFTKTKNNPDWKHPITLYTTVLIFKIFGTSYFNLRITSVVFALISMLIIFCYVKELINTKIALIAMILFLTTPIVMIQSHLAHDNIAPLPFISLWFLMLVKYTKKQEHKLLFFAGLSLGVSIITYYGLRLIAPILIVLTILYVYHLHVNHVKWFILGILPFIALLLMAKFFYPGSVLGLYRPYRIENYQNMVLPFISSFDPSFLFIKGDSTPYHSTGKHGMFLLASLPLFILGVVNIIKNNKPILSFTLISFFMVPVLFGLGSTIHRASRLLSLIPFYILISSVGVQTIIAMKHRLFRLGILILILLLFSFNYIDFLSDYWYQYPQRARAEFVKPVHKVYDRLAITARENNLNPLTEYYLFKSFPDAEDFFKSIYFPEGLSEWYREKKIPPKSVILTDLNNIPAKEKVDIDRVDDLDYYLIINKTANEI